MGGKISKRYSELYWNEKADLLVDFDKLFKDYVKDSFIKCPPRVQEHKYDGLIVRDNIIEQYPTSEHLISGMVGEINQCKANNFELRVKLRELTEYTSKLKMEVIELKIKDAVIKHEAKQEGEL